MYLDALDLVLFAVAELFAAKGSMEPLFETNVILGQAREDEPT
jgi:hypothetical protein